MSSGGGNRQRKSSDTSVGESANGVSPHAGQNGAKRHPTSKQNKPTKKQQHTPTTQERREEHWKVPTDNPQGSPLAKDLFGAATEAQQPFQIFDYDPYQYPNGPYSVNQGSGGYQSEHPIGKKSHNRTNPNASKHEGQSSSHPEKGNHRQYNGGSSQNQKTSKNSSKKPKNTPSPVETERTVQFDNQDSGSLKITVTDKPRDGKGIKDAKVPEKAANPQSSEAKTVSKSSPDKFKNPLMGKADDPQEKEGTSKVAEKQEKKEITNTQPRQQKPNNEKKENSTTPSPEGGEVKSEKRRKKRNRNKKKKMEKLTDDMSKQETIEKTNKNLKAIFSQPSPERTGHKFNFTVDSNQAEETSTTKSDSSATSTKTTPQNEVKSQDEREKLIESKEKKEKQTGSSAPEVRKKEEEMGLEQAEKRLKKDMIFKLEEKTAAFPDADYFCQLCKLHLNSVGHAHKHIKEKRHKKEVKAKEEFELLRQLKAPPPAALAALDRHLEEVLEKAMLSPNDAIERQNIINKLNDVISSVLKGCSVIMYGSSVTTIGLKESEINVDVRYSGDLKTPAVLMSLLDILKKSDQFTDVKEDFDAKVPNIVVKDREANIRCILSMNNTKSLHTARLLKLYGRIEPAAVKLPKLFRLWGHFCQIDKQHEGSLPSHSFALMVIFYLQQNHGLPVLHEIMAEHDIQSVLEETAGHLDILREIDGEWWYHPTAPPAGQDNSKTEDAEEETEEPAEYAISESDDDIDITFAETPVKNKTAPSQDKTNGASQVLAPVKIPKCFEKENPSIGELWLELLKFYTARFDMENLVITIRVSSKVTRGEKGWSHRRLAVEDPCSPKWNLCKPMSSQALFNYFQLRLKHSVWYFYTAHEKAHGKTKSETPQRNSEGAIDKTVKFVVKSMLDKLEASDNIDGQGHSTGTESPDREENLIQIQTNENQSAEKQLSDDKTISEGAPQDISDHCEATDKQAEGPNDPSSCMVDQTIDDVTDDVKSLSIGGEENLQKRDDNRQKIKYDSCYQFTEKSLTNGNVPVTICSVCKKEGHRKKNCPDEVELKIVPLPEFTPTLKMFLDIVTGECYEMFVPKEDEVRNRERVCTDILDFLQKNYDKRVQMCLFGSSKNRFTFRGSDLDICLTFDGNETGQDLDFAEVIESLAKVLRKDPSLRQIIPITTAKVPIVKFWAPRPGLEGDISLYNLLAQRNTMMLALYASIDERCRVLGYAMKAFVKHCGIGDASRGSLSSYAYILLVIYFLQQRSPPVLPVLQELYKGDKSPELIVDGWNSWFYDSIGKLDKVWPEFGQNKESVGELWLGMLRFYTEKFDFARHVVSIRQKKLLTAFEKEWTSKCICIEDPFDLSHNLGAGVSRKMTNFIMKVIARARERFGKEPGRDLNRYRNLGQYFFDVEFLTDGQEVPNDRCCRVCGKIGHFVKDCPKRRQRKKGNDESKMKDVECFNCGKKGHYRKDCQETKQGSKSPVKDAPHLQGPPVYVHPVVPVRPLMHNMVPNSPVVIHAKRQDSGHQRFQEPHNPHRGHETPGRRHQNSGPRERNTPNTKEKHSKSQNSSNRRSQNPRSSSPHSPTKSPFPSSGPNLQNNSRSPKKPAGQSVNRNLSNDFESDSRNGRPENPPHPSTPSRRSQQQASYQSYGEPPSPGTMHTLAEVESKMFESAKNFEQKPKSGDNLNHLIPRQASNEEMKPIPSSSYPTFHGYSPRPQLMTQLSAPPMVPPMHHPRQYMQQLSTSPQNQGNPFYHHGDYRQHTNGNDLMGRTPPSPMGQNFYPGSPQNYNHMYPPQPMSSPGFQRPPSHHRGDQKGYGMNPDPTNEPIQGRTFTNSNKGGPHREVHFTPPNNPGYHSYPPDRPHPNQPPRRNAPNNRM